MGRTAQGRLRRRRRPPAGGEAGATSSLSLPRRCAVGTHSPAHTSCARSLGKGMRRHVRCSRGTSPASSSRWPPTAAAAAAPSSTRYAVLATTAAVARPSCNQCPRATSSTGRGTRAGGLVHGGGRLGRWPPARGSGVGSGVPRAGCGPPARARCCNGRRSDSEPSLLARPPDRRLTATRPSLDCRRCWRRCAAVLTACQLPVCC
jgi:hypothetical protein